ncbi:Scr1 family TA system antitoxin-like transcriptional regulator, partial [Nocardia sp. NPDC003726]
FRQLIDHESNIMQHSGFRHNVNESQPRKTRSKGEPVEPPVVYLENFTGDMYLEKQADVDRYHEAHQAIRRAALDEKMSRDLFRQVAREFSA